MTPEQLDQVATGGWKSIASAPRDGTIIETMSLYGIAPWYGIFKWDPAEKRWVSANQPGDGVGEEKLYWRQWEGDPTSYVDPTRGAQESKDYWLSAMHS